MHHSRRRASSVDAVAEKQHPCTSIHVLKIYRRRVCAAAARDIAVRYDGRARRRLTVAHFDYQPRAATAVLGVINQVARRSRRRLAKRRTRRQGMALLKAFRQTHPRYAGLYVVLMI